MSGNISEVLLEAKKNGISLLDAEILLANVLKISKERIFAYPEKEVFLKDYLKFKRFIKKRLDGFSVAAILKEKEFYGFDFYVSENCLIPRPETEVLVDKALECIKILHGNKKIVKILDVGTGSGCIAVAIGMKNLHSEFLGVDKSKKALKEAKKNITRYDLETRIDLKESDLLNDIRDFDFDIITANLPYLSEKEMLDESVIKEPKMALLGGKDGMKFYNKLFRQISELDQKPKYLIFEFGYGQVESIKRSVNKYFIDFYMDLYDDLAGIPRISVIEFFN